MGEKRRLIVQDETKSPVAEAYRMLRTNLQFCQADSPIKSILFSSAGPGESKSTTVANTAVAMAQTGKSVVLVDCDLRKPVQHRTFQLKRQGVTDYLTQNGKLADFLQTSKIPGLTVMASGSIPPNPSELLGSDKMRGLLNQLREQFDYVLVDSPPIIAVTDAAVLSSRVDGVVIVLDAGTVHPEMAQRAKNLMLSAHANLLGVVLNRIEVEEAQGYYYYYYGDGNEKRQDRRR